MRAAGALLAGGHTIRDAEPKYGLAVVGTAHPDAIWAKSTAAPGDALFLTKPLGTGLVLHGTKRDLAGDAELAEAVRWMRMLNKAAAEALRPFEPSAVTDVTGFGLLGHAHEMASRSNVRLRLEARALPALPGALEVARAGERTGGDARNREFAGSHVTIAEDVPDDRCRARVGSADVGRAARCRCPPTAAPCSKRRSRPPGSSSRGSAPSKREQA